MQAQDITSKISKPRLSAKKTWDKGANKAKKMTENTNGS